MEKSVIDEKYLKIVAKCKKILEDANFGHFTRIDFYEQINRINKYTDGFQKKQDSLQKVLDSMNSLANVPNSKALRELTQAYGSPEDLNYKIKYMKDAVQKLTQIANSLEEMSLGAKNFNKNLCFSNIRELLKKNSEVKIGQIEKDAGIRLGYMSRLEKEDNTAEPSVEFIVTAAKLLNTSLDTLVSVDIAGLTPNEQYLVKFFDKLEADTIADKINWERERAQALEKITVDFNGNPEHPLFSVSNDGNEDVYFHSKSFGLSTGINDDCFYLTLKNRTVFYLMSVEKILSASGEPNTEAIEAWMFVPGKGCNVLVSSLDSTVVARRVKDLYRTVKNQMEHPRIEKEVQYAIDAFMKDDLSNDIPF